MVFAHQKKEGDFMASTLFGMMNTSTTGLMTSQVAISVTSNNIANVNTVGYTRQRALITSNGPIYYRGTGYLGTGVNIKDIQRIRDAHLDAQIRNETTTLSEHQTKLDVMKKLEVVFNEPSDTGLNATMSKFWSAWEELSKNPENSTMHTLVKENSKGVADQLNHLSAMLKECLSGVESQQEYQAGIAADLITQLNNVNETIRESYEQDPSRTPNELLDQRDLLTRQLSELMPITVKENADGTVNVTTTLETSNGSTTDVLALTKQDILDYAHEFRSGSIRGFEDMKSEIKNNYMKRLDDYTVALVEGINQAQGFEFFKYGATSPSGTIEVNPDLLNNTIKIATGPAGDGDNTTILATLNVRDNRVTINGQETTLDNYYKTIIADVGMATQHAESMVKSQGTLLGYLDDQYESISGVSLDEEVVNLVQFQKAYDANAKVVSTITDMLDTIINKLGV